MKKKNFVVSNLKNFWIKNNKTLYIANPYIFYMLETNNELSKYSQIEVAPYLRKSKEDLIHDSKLVNDKFEKYINILTARLNQIHGTNQSEKFWRKTLSMGLIRYITAFYDIFEICETYFNADVHDCKILSESSYFTPLDFEDHRTCFLNSDFGQEQIFSLYLYCYYPGKYTQINNKYRINHTNLGLIKDWDRLKIFVKQSVIKNVKQYYQKIFENKVDSNGSTNLTLTNNEINKNITLGIMGSFFSDENQLSVLSKSNNRVYPIDWNISYNYSDQKINHTARIIISKNDDSFDKFDVFFFSTLKYCFPKVFVEHFKEIEANYEDRIKYYPQLKYVISEAWLSNSYASIFLSILQKHNIIHICNEHNCHIHQCVGDFIPQVVSMSDIYTTIGWYDPLLANLIKSSSMFQFTEEPKKEKIYNILYVSGAIFARMDHFSSAWAYYEENIPKVIRFITEFFNHLERKTLDIINYRSYPKKYLKNYLVINKEYYIRDHLQHCKIASLDKSAKHQMAESRLVIVDYISTSHLEAFSMNIPTILFWDKDAFYLSDQYLDFYKPLIDVGICQTDPIEAAKFVDQISNNPEDWWFSNEVQEGKNKFMENNLGEHETMINYLLSLTRNKNIPN